MEVEKPHSQNYRDRTKIGKKIRRLIEAYSYFNYNESIDKFLTKLGQNQIIIQKFLMKIVVNILCAK